MAMAYSGPLGSLNKPWNKEGDLSQQDKRCVFLTVHDLGTNHSSLVDFVNSPAMTEIKERSCFIHVDVPGHEENSPDLPDSKVLDWPARTGRRNVGRPPTSYQFPSLQTLGEDLITVLDFLHVRYAVGIGEGAGANVLARCGLAHPRRLLGLILVNCTASTSSVADAFRSRFSRWRGADISQSEEDFLIYHKFGHVSYASELIGFRYKVWYRLNTAPYIKYILGGVVLLKKAAPVASQALSHQNQEQGTQIQIDSCEVGERERMLLEYRSRLRGNLNTHNIKLYVKAFINRKDLILRGCQPDILLITGLLSPYSSVVEKMYKELDKDKVTILKIEKVGDVLAEARYCRCVSDAGAALLGSLPLLALAASALLSAI
ncbi:hypothetical protein MSG28_007253 [Choristoneura fumiferana]|uniref:Uncharacterized protein n=1 Tax=Choristoneura fumiferana TaxID=7141 RepID=A0ACC0JW55_CHOFU|nr:hypothetical protein MSG28_007253 [Choristoneura fumiferana]